MFCQWIPSSYPTDLPWSSGSYSSACGTYILRGLSTIYDYYCASTSESREVEYLNSFYSTQIGSTVDPDGRRVAVSGFRPPSSTTTRSTISQSSSTSSSSSTTTTDEVRTSSSVTSQPATASPHPGLAAGAIAGIAVGAGCIALAVIAGIIVCCIMQKRRRARTAAQQTQPQPQAAFNHNPPMQQVFTDQAYPPNYAQSGQYPPSRPGGFNEAPGSPQTSTYASTYNGHPSPINSPLLAHDPTNRMSNIIPPPLPYNHSTPTPISSVSPKPPIVGDVENSASNYFKPPSSPIITEAGGMGAKIGHTATNDKDQLHEVSGVPIHVQDQNQSQFQGQSQGIAVHEISAQPEPKYTAYSPTLSTQHEQSFNTYTQSSVPEWSSTRIKNHQQNNQTSINEGFRKQPSSSDVWELPQ